MFPDPLAARAFGARDYPPPNKSNFAKALDGLTYTPERCSL